MDCVHHWKIETPNGGRWSAGSCIRHRFAAAFRIPPFHRDSWSLEVLAAFGAVVSLSTASRW